MSAASVERVDGGRARARRLLTGLVPVLGLVALVAIGATLVRSSIEQDIEGRVTDELATLPGADDVTVEVVGRDAVLGGEISPEVDADVVAERAGAVAGVRTVAVDGLAVVEAASTASSGLVLTVSGDGAVLTGQVQQPVDVDGLAAALVGGDVVDRTTTSPEAPASPGRLRLVGQVATTAERDAVVAAATALVGESAGIDDQLEVTG